MAAAKKVPFLNVPSPPKKGDALGVSAQRRALLRCWISVLTMHRETYSEDPFSALRFPSSSTWLGEYQDPSRKWYFDCTQQKDQSLLRRKFQRRRFWVQRIVRRFIPAPRRGWHVRAVCIPHGMFFNQEPGPECVLSPGLGYIGVRLENLINNIYYLWD